MINALSSHYDIRLFGPQHRFDRVLRDSDAVAFPGGIGDSDTWDQLAVGGRHDVREFVHRGGRYLGICMGAYWAGRHYFDLLRDVDAVQYIKQPGAEITKDGWHTARVQWRGDLEDMFFWDGTAFVKTGGAAFKTVAWYDNGDAMAIIQGNVGLIGCHPESEQHWYKGDIKDRWHRGRHHKLLLKFVNKLMEN
jgi:glutamine amidotransferase-like uncharacterized protein